MDAGRDPSAPGQYSTFPPPPTQPVPPTAGAGAPPPGRPPARWTAGAKATAVVLALTTVGGAGFGISQFTQSNDRADVVAALESDLDDADDELDDVRAELDTAAAGAEELQARLDTTNAELAAVTAERDTLASLFPLTASTLVNLSPKGSWGVTNTTDASRCEGFSDAAASCVPANFPTDVVVDGSPESGYTASSAWYPPVPLTFDGASWAGNGPVSNDYSNTCSGVVNATTVSVSFTVTGAAADPGTGELFPAELTGTVTIASGETTECVAASRSADFVTAAG